MQLTLGSPEEGIDAFLPSTCKISCTPSPASISMTMVELNNTAALNLVG